MARVLMRGRAEGQSQRRGQNSRSRGQREKMPRAALEVDAWAMSQGCRHLWKRQEARSHSLLDPPQGRQASRHLDFQPERLLASRAVSECTLVPLGLW